MRKITVLFTLFSVLPSALFAQHAVDPADRYFRLIAIVHLTGSGKRGDPILPEYVPKPGAASTRDGIIAWSSQLTDDGKMAIVHLAAVNHHAFDAVLADTSPDVKVFEIGKTDPALIVATLQQFRASFTLDSLKLVAQ